MRIITTLFALMLFLFSAPIWAQETETLMLSGAAPEDDVLWDFYCTDGRKSGEWSKIRVPSCWETEGFGTYNYGHDQNKASEKGIYRTTFKVPKSWKDKRVFVVFEGSMTDTKVKLNGKQAGTVHQGSFYRFKREITDLIEPKAENQLEVEVSKMSSNESVNKAERNADFWIFGGIYRPVYLEAVPKTFVTYTAIDAKHDGSITTELNLDKAVSDTQVNVEIFDEASGKKVGEFQSKNAGSQKTFKASSKLEGIKPWSAESPQRYLAVISINSKGKTLHSINEKFGFRTVEVRKHDGIYINDKKIRFKGVNRHCFWPSTGRSVSKAQSLLDIKLIKEMNMNAVRSSHYPPDKHFLELCDSLGLYVIDELTAWQHPPYNTEVGTPLVHEMVERDVNHPSVIFWANGNEGGHNQDFDPIFKELDIQKRPVIKPYGLNDGINTVHYISYNSGIKDMFNGRDIFMPTEILHGLYDGGHGAGLDDYWNLMLSNPLAAGMFLWDLADEGIVRTDKNGILDTDKSHGADGILGPYREKEGSFYTIKEIWSPVYFEKKYITPQWNGKLPIQNRYDFTNTQECKFSYALKRFISFDDNPETKEFPISSPNIAPGNDGELVLDLPKDWQEYDVLLVTAKDANGNEILTKSYELNAPAFFSERILSLKNPESTTEIKKLENDSAFVLSASGITVDISKKTGLLKTVKNSSGIIPLNEGPVFVTNRDVVCKKVSLKNENDSYTVDAHYDYADGGTAYRFSWKLQSNGILQLDYDYRPKDRIEMSGVTFNFPEKNIEGAQLIANGPYRVYNNRLKGGTLNLWDKKYNDAITGEVWEYPEFKGYYAHFYGMKLICPTPFEVYSASEDLFLHLFTPSIQQNYDPKGNHTHPPYPEGSISFMDAIPPVGTKFYSAENLGPQSQLHRFKSFSGSPNMSNRIYFRFNE
ncbi:MULTISPECIES: glycoside hydrolase family 2 TIM barrel-domain containing protein [unclassified Leeuwenhoekiella]|uniref:glycoside hydrolase family 2 protein n=1 Tax=unclassified Leeuwenhoekiella TaxID=2615029 RepID=UPI0025C0A750|nr:MULTISPECIES: glycoside hydrolase family 2 TIM barrel-domain containing protein [unclassified Leeuwenhoekiella]|tara:strand:- start:49325 stop:52114 length:2790 start_codon:yes stop_codon:yes gene_type:complete